MALTEKQKRFYLEYLTDLNATQAAIRAGYSKKTAYSQGQRLLKNVEGQKYLQELMAEKEKELIADQDEILKYLTSTMRREKKEYIVVTTSEEKTDYVPDKDGKTRRRTTRQETPQIVEIPARLSDANKAAELLGKAYGLYTEKIETDVDMDLNINIDYGDKE